MATRGGSYTLPVARGALGAANLERFGPVRRRPDGVGLG
jgi:hypothetical protein